MFGDFECVPLGAPIGFALFDVEAAWEVSRVDGDDFVVVGGLGCHVMSPFVLRTFPP